MVWNGGDGSVRKYALAGAGKWAAPVVDRPDTLYAVSSDCERRLPHGVKVRFNASGQHIKTINRLGDTTFFFYSSSRVDSIVVPSGTLRRTYTFVYDGSGKLDSVIAPGTSSARGVNVTVASGRLTSIRDPDLASTSFSHDASFTNRVNILTRPRGGTITFSFDSGAKVSTVQTSVGSGQAYSTLVSSFRPLESRGMASVGDGRAVDTAVAYAQINGPRTDVGDTTLFWLDKWGAPRKIRNAQGSETVITRAQGTYPALVTKLRLPSSQVLTATYDARGNIASVADSATVVNDTVSLTQYTWDPTWDFVTKIVPPERDSLTFAYDGSTGNRLWQRNALGDTVHFRYNSAGLLRASDGPLTPPDTVIYDEGFHDACVHDRVRVRPERPTHDPQARYRGGAPNGNDTTKYGYDAVGRSDGSSVSRTR